MASYIFTKENLLVSFTGGEEGLKEVEKLLPNFIESLGNKKEVTDPFVFTPNQQNEGFKAPYDVNYVALVGNYKYDNLPYTGALQVFQNIIATDYLWTNVRVLGGAYGCMCGFTGTGISYFVSYRDPNLTKTLETYKNVVNYLDQFTASEEEMTKYIIGAVGTYDYPKSPATKGARALSAYISGQTDENFKKEKAEIINATEADIKALKPYIESILKQNNICVIGNDKKVEEAKEIFKETKMLLK